MVRANSRQSSWSGVGVPQLMTTGASFELISKDMNPAWASRVSEVTGGGPRSQMISVVPASTRT